VLSSISVERYRCFASRAKLELRPLTVLFGKNSAGKSALLRAVPLIGASCAGAADNRTGPLALEHAAAMGARYTDLRTHLIARQWRDGLDANTVEAVALALEWSTKENAQRPSGVEVLVAARQDSAWSRLELTLADAVDLASRPFRVFVENAESDGRFLRAMLTPEEREWFDHLVEREWLLLQTAGGVTELKKCVAWAIETPSRCVRAAALFDGDAVEAPMAEPEADAAFLARLHPNSRAALRCCRDAQAGDARAFPHHVLRRRSIESYLPISTLERWAHRASGTERARRQRLVRAFQALPHRHRFHLKGGYAKDRPRNPPPSWLPRTGRRTVLEEGFGTAISECFDDARAQELAADGGFGELRPFLHALRSWIS
jgi:hypothetical protein